MLTKQHRNAARESALQKKKIPTLVQKWDRLSREKC
jgi:hypothetical protein